MNLEDIEARLREIREGKDDDEWAHGAADDLMSDTLQAIAEGATTPELLAAKALEVLDIDFQRWYA